MYSLQRGFTDSERDQIAAMLDLTLANVQQILSRSLRRLRGELDDSSLPRRTRPEDE